MDEYELQSSLSHIFDLFVPSLRDSSNESGATDTVGLSMNMSEMDDPEVKGKKKRGRPGKQAQVREQVNGARGTVMRKSSLFHVFIDLFICLSASWFFITVGQ